MARITQVAGTLGLLGLLGCQPNLQPVDMTGPATAAVGEAIGDRTMMRLVNLPAPPSNPAAEPENFFVTFFLSPDETITPDDLLIQDGREFVFQANQSQVITVDLKDSARIPAGAPTGPQFLGAFIDELNTVEEANEADNFISQPITITD